MTATEIILIIIGIGAVVIGYVLPAHVGTTKEEINAEKAKKHVDLAVRHALSDARKTIRGEIEDSMEETLVKSERGMDRITNDKISAINEYASTVMGDIHKNHDEVVFMYDMLNDKHKNLTSLVSDVSKSAADARQTVLDAELTAKESKEAADEAMEQMRQAKAEIEALIKDMKEKARADEKNTEDGHFDKRFKRAETEKDSDIRRTPLTAGDSYRDEELPMAETSYPAMSRMEDERFAPLLKDYPVIEPSDEIHRVLRSEPQDDKDDGEAERVADMVADILASKKVVPITNGSRDVRTRMDMSAIPSPISGGTVAYAEEALLNEAPRVQDRQDLILQMHNAGKSNVVIARELGVGVGEVRLVIDLFSNKRKSRK